ncbi:MAG: proline racemase [Actinomycetota bacterium]|jgi:proline racemase/trans-L-3-hydroxyproline dehydratase|nr:proline racemase [Actinomycetota bacterium]
MSTAPKMKIETTDYHTAGEPFRIVTGGVPDIPGARILDKRRFARENLDDIRKLLVFEPRGHADMYGCFVVEPEDDEGDLGVLFFHNDGYSTACGHGTIGLVTWAVESGRIAAVEPETRVVVDAPSGRLETFARVEGGDVKSVRFRNVPSFVFEVGMELKVDDRVIPCDISYGGAFYASVDAEALGLTVTPDNLEAFIRMGRQIKLAIENERDVVHPEEPELRDVYGVIFFETLESGPVLVQRNVTIFADGEVDRSPCGSGTSARLALLDASGTLPRGEELQHHGIVGTVFSGKVTGDSPIGSMQAVITEVEGTAHRTGTHVFELEVQDDLGTGFLLR